MSDLKLNSVLMRNWSKFRSAHIQFPDYGLVVVTGSNIASGGKLLSVGCHAIGQKILMYNGKLKNIEDIRERDRLMGPDSKPRSVLQLIRGYGDMYRIIPTKGKPFIVNEEHILSIKFTNAPRYRRFSGQTFLISVRDFISQPKKWQEECKLYRTGVTFPAPLAQYAVPPRILGLWLGDGTASKTELTSADQQLVQEWIVYGISCGLKVKQYDQTKNRSSKYNLTCKKGGNHRPGTQQVNLNPLREKLRQLGVWKNKHIPHSYLTGTREDRLSLLSGLLDTDGTLANNWFSYTSVNKRLAHNVEYLANSLGFMALTRLTKKKCQTGAICDAFLVSIIGDGSMIPTVCLNKKATIRKQKKRHNVTGFKIESVGKDNYYGFNLDRNGLYLLDDFTVTHNSGKTSFGEAIARTTFGVTGQCTIKECSLDEQGDTYVKITATLVDKPLIIEMGYKCPELSPTGEALRYTYEGKLVERGLIQQTRADLAAIIGISPLLAEWTLFVDGDALKFNRLSQQEQVELVMAAMKQPPWDAYHDRAKKDLGNCKKAVAKETGNLESQQQRVIRSEENVYAAENMVQSAQAEYARRKNSAAHQIEEKQQRGKLRQDTLITAQQRQAAIVKEIESITSTKSEAHHKLEIDSNKAQDRLRALQTGRKALLETWQKAQRLLDVKSESYNVLMSVPKTCPTCGKIWDKKVSPLDIAARKKELEDAAASEKAAREAYNTSEKGISSALTLLEECRTKITELNAKHSITALSTEHETLNRTVNRTMQELHALDLEIHQIQAGVDDSALKQAEATRAERVNVLEQDRKALEEASRSLTEITSAQKVMEYWCLAFSPAGIPNMVLQDAIGPLNAEAKRVSALMTGSTIDVRFNTKRTLATGDQKPELQIEVNNLLGSKRLKRNSKGEGGLTNFILAETFSNVGQVSKRAAFRWYDEVVPHKDQVVCRSIYSYMRELAHKLGILIFIVDHNPTAANYADYFLQIEKRGDTEACDAVATWVS